MFQEDGYRPSDERGFLHKSIIGRTIGKAVKTFVPAVGVASELFGTARSLLGGTGATSRRGFRPTRPTLPRTSTARPTLQGDRGKNLGRALKLGGDVSLPQITDFRHDAPSPSRFHTPGISGGGVCTDPRMVPGPDGVCRLPGDAAEFGFGVGQAVMGRYGAALQPGQMLVERSVCLAGMQLGNDGLCYNKGAITNAQRQWPRGRRPLLTGGDLNAISIAARAGSKLDRTTKRLRSLGMMKALPRPRSTTKAHAHAKQVAAVSVPQ